MRIRGHSSLSLEFEAEYACEEEVGGGEGKEDTEEDRRWRKGEREESVRLRPLLSVFESRQGRSAFDDGFVVGGEGIEGRGMLSSV